MIDFLLFGPLQGNEKTNWLWVIPVGIAWAAVYYFVFRLLITKFKVKVPGMEIVDPHAVKTTSASTPSTLNDEAKIIIDALGNDANIESVSACATRLRISVKDPAIVEKDTIKNLGATAVFEVQGGIQAVFGGKADLLSQEINQIMGNQETASQVAQMLFGGIGGKLVTVGILISVYGALNGYTFTAIRVPYALASEGNFPFAKTFVKLNRFASPWNSSVLVALVSIGLMLSNQFDPLTDLAVFISWLFFILLFLAVFKLRKTMPDKERPYKTWLYPVTPIVAILGGIFILFSYITNSANLPFFAFGMIMIVLGIIVFKKISK